MQRPKLRGECMGEGACLALGCRYNLLLEVTPAGSIKSVSERSSGVGRVAFDGRRKTDIENARIVESVAQAVADAVEADYPTCALDLADDGPMTLQQVAEAVGVGRERVRQDQDRALARIRKGKGFEGLRSYLSQLSKPRGTALARVQQEHEWGSIDSKEMKIQIGRFAKKMKAKSALLAKQASEDYRKRNSAE